MKALILLIGFFIYCNNDKVISEASGPKIEQSFLEMTDSPLVKVMQLDEVETTSVSLFEKTTTHSRSYYSAGSSILIKATAKTVIIMSLLYVILNATSADAAVPAIFPPLPLFFIPEVPTTTAFVLFNSTIKNINVVYECARLIGALGTDQYICRLKDDPTQTLGCDHLYVDKYTNGYSYDNYAVACARCVEMMSYYMPYYPGAGDCINLITNITTAIRYAYVPAFLTLYSPVDKYTFETKIQNLL